MTCSFPADPPPAVTMACSFPADPPPGMTREQYGALVASLRAAAEQIVALCPAALLTQLVLMKLEIVEHLVRRIVEEVIPVKIEEVLAGLDANANRQAAAVARCEAVAGRIESCLDRFNVLLVNLERRIARLEGLFLEYRELLRGEGAGPTVPATIEAEM